MAPRLRREILAGLSTFLTIAYLFIVYPQLLSAGGLDLGAAFTATVLITTISTLFVGIYAKTPIALGPGLGAGVYLVYSLLLNQSVPWSTILGFVFWSALAMFILSIFKLRQKFIYNLPTSLKIGTMAGIGLFLVCVGLKELHILIPDPDTFWTIGEIGTGAQTIALLSLVLLLILYQRRISGCYILAILFAFFVGICWDLIQVSDQVTGTPPSLAPLAMSADLGSAIQLPMLANLLALFLINIFDTSASITTLTKMADMTEENGHIRHLNKLVLTDGPGSMLASVFGVGTLSFLVESSAGIKAGGRMGWTAVTVGVCSLAALFFFPLFSSIPLFATAPVLIVVGCVMVSEIRHLEWGNFIDLVPALLTLIIIPLTFSIYAGFAVGFISFTILKALRGQAKQVHPICWIITLFFLYHYLSS